MPVDPPAGRSPRPGSSRAPARQAAWRSSSASALSALSAAAATSGTKSSIMNGIDSGVGGHREADLLVLVAHGVPGLDRRHLADQRVLVMSATSGPR